MVKVPASAGGIMSASLDGYHVARAVMAKFTPFFLKACHLVIKSL